MNSKISVNSNKTITEVIGHFVLLVLLLFIFRSTVKADNPDPYYKPKSVALDSLQLLMQSISYFEAGFQRGEVEPLLKRISADYTDKGKHISLISVRQQIINIFENKNAEIQTSENNAGIYFCTNSIDFRGKDMAIAHIEIYAYTGDERSLLVPIDLVLEFKLIGGGWVLYSSNGLLDRLNLIYSNFNTKGNSDINYYQKRKGIP